MQEKIILKQIVKRVNKPTSRKIVKFISGFKENKEQFLIFELMDGNITNQTINLNDIFFIMNDISFALKGLHEEGFAHMDVRPGKLIRKHFI
jgi:serine/threonine protein kinase